ncbi:MAG: hypothetical protein BRC22_00115 [Parcubacteria group bacterium QH_9_35_7]|nr:MAG: hypothetical protein BRC22_00115 [Parcubacteria group bacterium QH_9_35_7]
MALPALILHSLATTDTQQLLSFELIVFNTVVLIVYVTILYLILSQLDLSVKLRNTYFFGAFFGTVAYIGFPFIQSIFTTTQGTISILVAIHVAVAFSLGLYFLERSSQEEYHFYDTLFFLLKNPLIWAVIVGIFLLLFNFTLPNVIFDAIQMLANSASPVVLVAIGSFITKNWPLQNLRHAFTITGLKIILMPLIFSLGLLYFPASEEMTISIVEAGMSVALTNFALSEMYPIDQHTISSSIIISVILSMITLPLLVFLF